MSHEANTRLIECVIEYWLDQGLTEEEIEAKMKYFECGDYEFQEDEGDVYGL